MCYDQNNYLIPDFLDISKEIIEGRQMEEAEKNQRKNKQVLAYS